MGRIRRSKMAIFEKSNNDIKSQSFEGLFHYLNKMRANLKAKRDSII